MLPGTHWYPGCTRDPDWNGWPTDEQEKNEAEDIKLAVQSMMDTISIKELLYFFSETDEEAFTHLLRFIQTKDYTGAGVNLYAILQDEATEYVERQLLKGKRLDQVWEDM